MNPIKKYNYNLIHTKKAQQGAITIFALTMTLMMALFSLFFLQIMQLNHQLIHKRFETYLCYRYQDQRLKKHIERMKKINIIIATAFYAQFSPNPAISGAAKLTLEIIKNSQNVYAGVFVAKTLKTPHCTSVQNISYLKGYPFKNSGLVLARLPDQRAYLKGATWKNYLYHSPASDRFILEITYRDQENKKTELKEIPLTVAVPSWKRYFGPL